MQPYFEGQLEATATFPRRQAQPSEMWMGTKYLIENEMMNAFDVSDLSSAGLHLPSSISYGFSALQLHIDGNWHLVSDWQPGTDREYPPKNLFREIAPLMQTSNTTARALAPGLE